MRTIKTRIDFAVTRSENAGKNKITVSIYFGHMDARHADVEQRERYVENLIGTDIDGKPRETWL